MRGSVLEARKICYGVAADAEGQHHKEDLGQREQKVHNSERRLIAPETNIDLEDLSLLDHKRVRTERGRLGYEERTMHQPPGRLSARRCSDVSNQSLHSKMSHDSGTSTQSKPNKPRISHAFVDEQPAKEQPKKVFVDAEQMKEKIRNAAFKKPYDVSDYYYPTGLFQRIARHPKFEAITLTIIAFNALWITVDTDTNSSEVLLHAHPVFQCAEQFFCLYFSFEWFVRFKSFQVKRNCLRDAWFVFDSCLVLTMVLETWLMATVMAFASTGGGGGLGNASMLRLARLLRLSRMARMARLFRAMPELLILIKAMAASLRSCFFVFILLTIILYVFGIAFRQLTDASDVGDQFFFTVFASMHTLWKYGTLLDGLGDLVAALAEDSYVLVALFYLFLLLSALTVMNMLIGVLCEVVSTVASLEKEQMTVTFVKAKLQEIINLSGLDNDANGEITKAELSALLGFPEACKCLSDVGVDVFMLVDNIDFIFATDDTEEGAMEDDEKSLSFSEFMDLILDLRGSNNATVKDMVQMQKYIKKGNRRLREEMHKVKDEIKKFISAAVGFKKGGDSGSGLLGINPHGKTPPSLATTVKDYPKITYAEESLKLLKEEIKLLVGQSMLPELQASCAKIESDCRKVLEALAADYEVRLELMEVDNRRKSITQRSLNARAPGIDNDKARTRDDVVQGATAARYTDKSRYQGPGKHLAVSHCNQDDALTKSEREFFRLEVDTV